MSKQGLNSHGSHLFAVCRVVVDDDEGQRDEEETAVIEEYVLNQGRQKRPGYYRERDVCNVRNVMSIP